jgi:hypothetical protein
MGSACYFMAAKGWRALQQRRQVWETPNSRGSTRFALYGRSLESSGHVYGDSATSGKALIMGQHWHRHHANRSTPPDRDSPIVAPPNLEMMTCHKRSMRLTVGGCARIWLSANTGKPPEAHEGRSACRGCPIGAFNATGKPPDPAADVREKLRRTCSRCGRLSDRIIHFETRGHCASCDARHGESRRGANAKGTPPRLTALLHTEQALVTSADGSTHILTRHHVLSFLELTRQAERTATESMTFRRWVTLAGGGHSENTGTGHLGPSMALAGTATSQCHASAAPLSPVDMSPRPVTSWMTHCSPKPVTSWMRNWTPPANDLQAPP